MVSKTGFQQQQKYKIQIRHFYCALTPIVTRIDAYQQSSIQQKVRRGSISCTNSATSSGKHNGGQSSGPRQSSYFSPWTEILRTARTTELSVFFVMLAKSCVSSFTTESGNNRRGSFQSYWAGYWSGKDTRDLLVILLILIEKVNRLNEGKLYLLFIDYTKAFDTVKSSSSPSTSCLPNIE